MLKPATYGTQDLYTGIHSQLCMILSQDMGTMEVITRQCETFTNLKMLCINATSQYSIKLFYGGIKSICDMNATPCYDNKKWQSFKRDETPRQIDLQPVSTIEILM